MRYILYCIYGNEPDELVEASGAMNVGVRSMYIQYMESSRHSESIHKSGCLMSKKNFSMLFFCDSWLAVVFDFFFFAVMIVYMVSH